MTKMLLQHLVNLVDDLEQRKEIALDWFFGLKNDLDKTIRGKIRRDAEIINASQNDLLKISDWLENFDYDCGLAYDNNDNAKFIHSLPATSFQEMRDFLQHLQKGGES